MDMTVVTTLAMVSPGSQSEGYRYRLSRALNYRLEHVAPANSECMGCGSTERILFASKAAAAFDLAVLPPRLKIAFMSRAVGHCKSCGLGQNFHRLTSEQIVEWVGTLKSKDQTVSEDAFHSFPVPRDYIDAFNATHFSTRLQAWKDVIPFPPQKVLFLRPMFGAGIKFFQEQFGSKCYAMEISDIARRTIELDFSDVEFLDGNIHADFYGHFLSTGPYDAIVCYHTVIHSINASRMMEQIKSLLRPGGFVIFASEIALKPSNPFHTLFADEDCWIPLCGAHFSDLIRIPNCEVGPPSFISNFTHDGTSTDYLGFSC